MRTISQLQAILDSEREWLETCQHDANPNDPFDQIAISFCRRRVEHASKNLARQTAAEEVIPKLPLTP